MALYRATKNLSFASLGIGVIVDEVIELEKDYADKVNKDLKLTFPDVPSVLVLVEDAGIEPKKPTKRGGKKSVKDETLTDAPDETSDENVD